MLVSWDLHDLIKIKLNLQDRGIQLSKLYSSLCTAAPPLKKIGKELLSDFLGEGRLYIG